MLFSHAGSDLAPKRADGRNTALLEDDMQPAATVRRRARGNLDETLDLAFTVVEGVQGNAAAAGCALAPAALVNASGVVADDEDIDVVQVPGRQASGMPELRPGLHGDELAEQIEAPAQVVDIAAAAWPAENRATAFEDAGAEGHHLVGQPLTESSHGRIADQAPVAHLKMDVRRLFDGSQDLHGRSDDFRSDTRTFQYADQRPGTRSEQSPGILAGQVGDESGRLPLHEIVSSFPTLRAAWPAPSRGLPSIVTEEAGWGVSRRRSMNPVR